MADVTLDTLYSTQLVSTSYVDNDELILWFRGGHGSNQYNHGAVGERDSNIARQAQGGGGTWHNAFEYDSGGWVDTSSTPWVTWSRDSSVCTLDKSELVVQPASLSDHTTWAPDVADTYPMTTLSDDFYKSDGTFTFYTVSLRRKPGFVGYHAAIKMSWTCVTKYTSSAGASYSTHTVDVRSTPSGSLLRDSVLNRGAYTTRHPRVYIADNGNGRLHQMYNWLGTRNTHPTYSFEGGMLTMSDVRGIDLDYKFSYVSDAANDHVVKLYRKWDETLGVNDVDRAHLELIGWGVPYADYSTSAVTGSSGTGSNQYDTPHGVYVGTGSVYVADYGNNRIQSLTTDLVYNDSFGSTGSGDGEFVNPTDIDGDGDHLFVLDSGNTRVCKHLESDYSYVTATDTNIIGSGASGLTVDNLFVFVADTSNNRILRFNKTGLSLDGSMSVYETGVHTFSGPRGVYSDGYYVYVTDTGNHRVVRVAKDFDLGSVTYSAGSGSGTDQLSSPWSVAADRYLYSHIQGTPDPVGGTTVSSKLSSSDPYMYDEPGHRYPAGSNPLVTDDNGWYSVEWPGPDNTLSTTLSKSAYDTHSYYRTLSESHGEVDIGFMLPSDKSVPSTVTNRDGWYSVDWYQPRTTLSATLSKTGYESDTYTSPLTGSRGPGIEQTFMLPLDKTIHMAGTSDKPTTNGSTIGMILTTSNYVGLDYYEKHGGGMGAGRRKPITASDDSRVYYVTFSMPYTVVTVPGDEQIVTHQCQLSGKTSEIEIPGRYNNIVQQGGPGDRKLVADVLTTDSQGLRDVFGWLDGSHLMVITASTDMVNGTYSVHSVLPRRMDKDYNMVRLRLDEW